MTTPTVQPLPETGFLRESQILGSARHGIAPLIPIGRSAWWQGIREGRYPSPIKLAPRTTAWRVEDIRALIERLSAAPAIPPRNPPRRGAE
jgi:predicted DNA-binding transcriptional regulator AlpA